MNGTSSDARRLAAFFCALWALACAPSRPPETERASHFTERLYHVYVVSNLESMLGPTWADAVHRDLSAALAADKVTHSIESFTFSPEGNVRFDTIEQREATLARVTAFQPETVLFLLAGPTGKGAGGKSALLGLWLFTPDDEELVWALAYGFSPREEPRSVAAKVLAAMERDGLIRTAARTGEGTR